LELHYASIKNHETITTINDILSGDNNLIKVWYLYFRWAGYFIGHKIGIRQGNYNMQMANLAAFAPLFPAAGKNNYASSVAHYLAQVNDDPKLQKLLQTVCSVNLANEGHYFGFDEALERKGVKFIKQNITGNLTDKATMMSKIKAAQSERDRLSMLLSEYAGDIVVNQRDRAVKSRKELLSLIANLSSAFESSNPETLFENAPEINDKGIENILSCYEAGKLRFEQILAQDVRKSEPRVSVGRRKRNIAYYTYAKLMEMKKSKSKSTRQKAVSKPVERSSNQATLSTPPEMKQTRRPTTEAEKAILAQLFEIDNESVEARIDQVVSQLQGWDKSRVKQYLRNNSRQKRTEE